MIAPQVQAQLQRLNDRELQHLLNNQSPEVPAFYVLAELNRRSTMRRAQPQAPAPVPGYAMGGRPRTAEEEEMRRQGLIEEGYGVPPPRSGSFFSELFKLGPKNPKPTPIILAPEENDQPYQMPPDVSNGIGAAIGVNDVAPMLGHNAVQFERVKEQVPDAFQFKDRSADRAAAIAADRVELERQRKRDWYNTLMQGGVAMAAGTSPDFIQNAAKGFQSGLNTYNDLRADRRKRAEALTAQERGLDEQSELTRYKNDVNNRAVAAQRANVDKTNVDITNREREYNATSRQQVDLVNLRQRGQQALMSLRSMSRSAGKLPAGAATAAKVLVADFTERVKGATTDEQKAAAYSELVRQWNSLLRQFETGAGPRVHNGLEIIDIPDSEQ